MDAKTKLKERVIIDLRAIAGSVKGFSPLRIVANDYRMMMGQEVPYKELGHKTLAEFFRSNPKEFRTKTGPTGELLIDIVVAEKSEMMSNMISKQKTKVRRPRKARFASSRSGSSNYRQPRQSHNWKPQSSPASRAPNRPAPKPKQSSVPRFAPNYGATSSNPVSSDRLRRPVLKQQPQEIRTEIKRTTKSPPIIQNNNNWTEPERPKSRNFSRNSSEDSFSTASIKTNSTSDEVESTTSSLESAKLSEYNVHDNIASPCCETPLSPVDRIPKDLLRDTPLFIPRQEILDRSKQMMINADKNAYKKNNNNNNNTGKVLKPSSGKVQIRSDAAFVENMSSSSSNASDYAASTLIQPVSPIILAPTQPLQSRGRGRLPRSTTTAPQPFIFPSIETISRPSSTPSPPTAENNCIFEDALCPSEAALQKLLVNLSICDKPEVKIINRKPSHESPVYFAQVKVGSEINVSTFPTEYKSREGAREAAFSAACSAVSKRYAGCERLPVAHASDIKRRVIPLLAEHPTGVWADMVKRQYTELHKERLPDDWLDVIRQCGVAIEYAANDKCILMLQTNINENGQFPNTIPDPIMPEKGPYYSVVITWAINTNEVWFRIIGDAVSEQYRAMIEDLELHYKRNTVSATTQIHVGQCYGVNENDTYMRVKVLELYETEALCIFLDDGHIYQLPLDRLLPLPNEFRSLPAQAIRCNLAGMQDLADNEAVITHLENLIGRHLFVQIHEEASNSYSEDDSLPIVLFDTTGPTDIVLNEYIIKKVIESYPTPQLQSDYNISEMTVVHVDPVGYIYLQPTGEHSEGLSVFLDLMQRLSQNLSKTENDYVTSTKNIDSSKIFIAKYEDGSWYRCAVKEKSLTDNTVTVFFIDYGNTMTIDLNKSKKNLLVLETLSNVLQHFAPQCVKAQLYQTVKLIPPDLIENLTKQVGENYQTNVLVKVMISVDKPSRVPIIELFKRTDNGELFSINRSLGLIMREPKQDSNNNKKDLSRSNSLTNPIEMKSLLTFPSTGDLPTPELPDIDMYYDVNVPSAVNPWNFFVQPYVNGRELKDMMNKLQCYCNTTSNAELTLDQIKPGEVYVARHNDNVWYRACINKTIDHDSISAFFVDFGLYVVLASNQLQTLHSDFKKFPFQAIKARLTGIKPRMDKWSVDDCRTFQSLVIGKQFVSVVKEIGKDVLHSSDIVLCLQLIDTSTDKDQYVHEMLIEQGIATACNSSTPSDNLV